VLLDKETDRTLSSSHCRKF